MHTDFAGIRSQVAVLRTLARRQRRRAALYARLARNEREPLERELHEGTSIHALGTADVFECRAEALESWLKSRDSAGSAGHERVHLKVVPTAPDPR